MNKQAQYEKLMAEFVEVGERIAQDEKKIEEKSRTSNILFFGNELQTILAIARNSLASKLKHLTLSPQFESFFIVH